jgi:hypothetical protein
MTKRAYELYEPLGRQDGRAVQDWRQVEREIGNPELEVDEARKAENQ